MKQTKKGFTLIELLAVIIILAVIALIATPIVLNVVDKAKTQADMQTVNGILDAARLYYSESILDETKKIDIDNVKDIYEKVYLHGHTPTKGSLYVNNQGLTSVSVILNKKCYIKTFNGQVEVIEDEDCDLGFVGNDNSKPEIIFSYKGTLGTNEWYITNDNWIKAEIKDLDSGVEVLKYCVGLNCNPDQNAEIDKNNNKELIVSQNIINDTDKTQLCIYTSDKLGNSISQCSKIIKIDTTKPNINGIEDKVVNIGTVVDLNEGITTLDVTSGLSSEIIINPSTVDTSIAGTTNIEYSVTDNAGNTTTITRKIIVDAQAPTVTYTPQGSTINSNGWSKQDFYVKVDLVDNSGLGIKEGKWCITQSNTCTPNAVISGTTMTPLITTESNNNRICIQATDNNNKQSQIICSDAYKLDKTVPIVGTLNISGTLGSNSWYTTNITISTNNGSDGLSGHNTTITDISSITSNTTGQTITLTTTDLAGNQATRTQTIKVDKTAPTLTAKSDTIEITEGDSVATSTYFNSPSYSISGGSISCNPSNTSSLAVGNRTITCTATGNNGLVTTVPKTITVNSNIVQEYPFSYTGNVQTFVVPKTGLYKLEVWGAQGGTSLGGKGGYSKGTVLLTVGTKLYIYVGQAGNYGNSTESFNGGGSSKGTTSDPRGTGGGATDIRINSDSLYTRVIVAGGGGGGAGTTLGGAGGGTIGISGNSWDSIVPGNDASTSGGMYGSQIAGGIFYNKWTSTQVLRIASFGLGGSTASDTTIAGGGGGWYGGAAGNAGGGGAGWIYTDANFTNWKTGNSSDSAKWLLNSSYYLSEAQTIAGNTSIPTHNGNSTTIGNSDNGYAKITSTTDIEQPEGDDNPINFSYTGNVQTFIVPTTGLYKLEVWGAQGGTKSNYIGGKGGYSKGEISLLKDDKLYIYVGGKGIAPTTSSNSFTIGGFNGGGQSYGSLTTFRGSGGGATDIRIKQDSLYSRVIVAGGGGGAWETANYLNNVNYAVGGGISGGNSTGHGIDGSGGTQTTGGSNSADVSGTFGNGGGTASNNTYCGGGSGWYGGGGSSGGSGYVYTSATASNYPSGCLLNSSYYLINSETIAGNLVMPNHSNSGTIIGNANNGYAKITLIK